MMPSQVPSATSSRPSGRATTMTQRKRAVRRAVGNAAQALEQQRDVGRDRRRRRRRACVGGEARRAHARRAAERVDLEARVVGQRRQPGSAPPAPAPWRGRWRGRCRRPRRPPARRGRRRASAARWPRSPSRARYSRSLPALCVATTRITTRGCRPAPSAWHLRLSSAIASLASAVQPVELLGRERLRLGGALHLDELAAPVMTRFMSTSALLSSA